MADKIKHNRHLCATSAEVTQWKCAHVVAIHNYKPGVGLPLTQGMPEGESIHLVKSCKGTSINKSLILTNIFFFFYAQHNSRFH